MSENQLNITPEYILELVIRRRWVILISVCLALVAGITLAIVLPKEFEATTLILIEPQRVPQNYVRSIVSSDPSDRINTLSQQILSRTNLEKIISDFKLFTEKEYENLYDEDKINNLTKRINVRVTRDRQGADAFSISFRGKDPVKVMRVTNALSNSFIDENLKVRESQAMGTSTFLDSELESMRNRLERVEENIKQYRKQYMGELPEQLNTNLSILDRLQANLNNRQESLRDAKIRLADLKTQQSTRAQQIVVIGSGDQNNIDGNASIGELKAQLETLSARYTEKHPDVLRLKKLIAELESKQESIDAGSGDSSQQRERNYSMSPQLRIQISEVEREIRYNEMEIEDIKNKIQDYQKRVDNTPKREQEILGLRRDYENIQSSYESLLSRKLEADIAVNMERKQKGEQFRIIDPAKVPQKPVSPNTKKLFAIILAAGLGIGGGIAFLLEFLNTSFRKPDAIETAFNLPVIVTLPKIYSPRQKFWNKVNVVCSLFVCFIAAGLFGFFTIICLKGADPVLAAIHRVL